MKLQKFLRLASCVLSLMGATPAVAQMREQELAEPRVKTALVAEPAAVVSSDDTPSDEECHRLLRDLTNTLQLQPYQVVVVRQALAAKLGLVKGVIPAAEFADETNPDVTPNQVLFMVLTEGQLTRLQQWEVALPAGQRRQLLASLR
jgi:hypothetical protein